MANESHDVNGINGANGTNGHNRVAEAIEQTEWEPMIPLNDGGTADPFPVDVFPPGLAAYVREVAASMNAPPDYAGAPLLVLSGAAIASARTVHVKDRWDEFPNLYVAVIAPSGSAKSPAQRELVWPFREKQRALVELKISQAEPNDESVTVGDVTQEKLGHILRDSPGIIRIEDELARMILSMNQYHTGGRGGERQFYLSAWSGGSIDVHRVTQEHDLYVHRPFLSILGALVPGQISKLIGELSSSDGFIDRFLFAYPPPPPAKKVSLDDISPRSVAAWHATVDRLWVLRETLDEDGPRRVPMEKRAWNAWVDFTDRIASEHNAANFSDNLKPTWKKAVCHAVRIALILHYLWHEDGDLRPISSETVERALSLMGYFLSHARKVHAVMGSDPITQKALAISTWIRRYYKREFRARDCFTNLLHNPLFNKMEDCEEPLIRLEKYNVIRPKRARLRIGPGRPPGVVFEVNPEFLGTFSGYLPNPDDLVAEFQTLWKAAAGKRVTLKEIDQAKAMIEEYGHEKALALIPIAVRAMEKVKKFREADNFCLLASFFHSASRFYDQQHDQSEAKRNRKAEDAEEREAREGREAAEKESRAKLEAKWSALSVEERAEIEEHVRGIHGDFGGAVFMFKVACFQEMKKRAE